VNIILNDGLEGRFRKAIFDSMGMKKWNISGASEEAVKLSIRTQADTKAKKR